MMMVMIAILMCIRYALALPSFTESESASVAPSLDTAAERGPRIFNAIFDSLRHYGSTLHPNGMSFTVATVPAGVLLHHGSGRNTTPTTFDWLAFEIEHAEVFARPIRWRRPQSQSSITKSGHFELQSEQIMIGVQDYESATLDNEEEGHGWLHTYRVTEPLRFLYLDGMSGNKDDTGVIDTQDYILRASPSTVVSSAQQTQGPPLPAEEFDRIEEICRLCTEWQLQGVIRTETPGSEIIKCDFSVGLEEVQSLQRKQLPPHSMKNTLDVKKTKLRWGGPGRRRGDKPGEGIPYDFEGVFRDIGSSRVILDYSTTVSVFSFPVNITNPDTHPIERNLPRLVETTPNQRLDIKNYVAKVVTSHYRQSSTSYEHSQSWRDIADLIVRRYAQHISSMANESELTTVSSFLKRIQFLLNVFVDYSIVDAKTREAQARERCVTFYLDGMPLRTESDEVIYEAFKATNAHICTALFDTEKLLSGDTANTENLLSAAKAALQQLKDFLDWSVFPQ